MDPLILRLMGHPTVIHQSQSLKFRSRKVFALLIYLVVEGGWHSREKLMAWLWPESDKERGGASLRSTVARLRRTLPAGKYLLTEQGDIAFDFERPFELDLQRIEAADQEEARPEAWQAVLAADRGEFLAGFSLPDAPEFDTWAAVQREAWHHRLERIYERLCRRQLEGGESAQAVKTAIQWTARAPLNETAYRHLMEAYYLAGDRIAAWGAFENCQRMLDEELGVEPAPETISLAERIRTVSPPRRARAVAAPPAPLAELPLVGRSVEHSQLVSAYRQVCQGKAQVVCVSGEAGIGKTRLTRAFLKWTALEETGADILTGRAFEVGGRLPYQPLVEALRTRLEAENAPDDLLSDVWLAELSQLLPELRERYPDLPPPMIGAPDFVRARIFEAVARLGEALASRQPLVLFLDDMQWTDEDTLDLLHYLGRRWAQGKRPILLLLAVRQEALVTTPRLTDWLTHLGREVPLTQLSLSPLKSAAIQQLVSTLAGRSAPGEPFDATSDEPHAVQQFGAWLLEETGGQPFFMVEMLKMLGEGGILVYKEAHGRDVVDFVATLRQIKAEGQLPLPPTVREVILARLGRLTETAAALLLAGAVIGRECSFERLCQVARVAEREGLAALGGLLNHRLLLEMGPDVQPYIFAHDKIREVVYTEAGEARRRIYHRRAFTALEGAGAPAAELAFQAVAARLNEPAFHYSLAAGDEAMAAYASAEALAHYGQALALAKQEALTVTSGQLIHLYSRRGRAYELLNQFDEALQTYQEMAEQAAERGDEALKLASLSARCIVHATQTPLYNPSEARAQAEQALALARELEDRATEARVLWGLSLLGAWAGQDYSQALANGEQSLAISRELGLKEQMAFTLTSLASLYANLDQLEAALSAILEARTVWRELGNMPMLADAYNLAAWFHMFIGDHEAVLASAREGISISQSIGNAWNLAGCLVAMGKVWLEQGDIGRAIGNLKEAMQVAKEGGIPVSSFGIYNYLILAYLMAGAVDQAERLATELYEIRDTIVFNFRILALGYIAQVKVAGGEQEAAQRIVEQALEGLEIEKQAIYLFAPVLLAEAQLQLALGQPGDALTRLEYLTGQVRQAGARSYLPEALWLQGKVLLGLEQPEQARQILLEARAAAEEAEVRRMGWPVLWELSQLEAAAGNIDEAERLQEQARAIVISIADHTGSEEVQASFLALPEVRAILRPSSSF
jgi:predicted ATPase/DNA-binding SARP family transcriptional activator